jgi:transposase InsO family protein
LLHAIARAQPVLRQSDALRIAAIAPAAYQVWRKQPLACAAEPSTHAGNCPRARPRRLTATEVATIHDMATAEEYRHVSISRLAMLARRLGRVFASARTWHELVKRHGWRRPCRRVYPPKPKAGVRAAAPNELWHIDVTVVHLLDGGRAFIQAIIDNFSRRILAWRVSPALEPAATATLLTEAAKLLPLGSPATVVADSGVENINSAVDELIGAGALRRILAQVEVAYSNSMIEAFWRQLKHDWLYLNPLDSVAAIRRLTTCTWSSTTRCSRTEPSERARPMRRTSGVRSGSTTSCKSARRRPRRSAPRRTGASIAACASGQVMAKLSTITRALHLHTEKSELRMRTAGVVESAKAGKDAR